jgi:hypothetical protein
MTERDLDLLLQRTAASMAYPATPQLRARVLTAVHSQHDVPQAPSPAIARRRPVFAFATIAAVIAAFAAMIALAVPTSRGAIADFFGIERSKVERLPTPPAGATATPFPPGSELPPGAREATLEEASGALGFDVALPAGAGEPRSVYLVRYAAESIAILRYDSYDLWEAKPRGSVFLKGVGDGSIVLDLTTPGGRQASFITGGGHRVSIYDGDVLVPGSERTVERNTLVFNTGHAFYRIETDMPRSSELLNIADSLP